MHLTTQLAGAALAAWTIACAAALAVPPGVPHYIGTVTGSPERDTYGYEVATTDQELLCIVGPKQYFGRVTGDPEKDNYGYATARVPGTSCSLLVADKK